MDFGNKGFELSGATGFVPDLNVLFIPSLLEASMCFRLHRPPHLLTACQPVPQPLDSHTHLHADPSTPDYFPGLTGLGAQGLAEGSALTCGSGECPQMQRVITITDWESPSHAQIPVLTHQSSQRRGLGMSTFRRLSLAFWWLARLRNKWSRKALGNQTLPKRHKTETLIWKGSGRHLVHLPLPPDFIMRTLVTHKITPLSVATTLNFFYLKS